ncbi:BadF/BadG/BcrA/BcrD ATPase family protein [Caldivirga sp. MU80]|uniref:BadF/BadG/BcrA/BcrD ATPase family protein n=1 Tax=Caldivirga sp. MU80 TaxID=1650354 RepID=UPI0008336B5D|nr:BadF/BadG/BcrA/BcrD ATPase family protein [Caldivirga sp. MU80]
MIIMALDSGKTRTSAVAIDEGFNVLCRAEGRGGGLIYSNDVIKDALVTTINRCLRSMGVSADSVDLIVVSWADLDTEAYWVKASGIIGDVAGELGLPGNRLMFDHDAVAAYYAITLGEPGVAVIAGTGAIALGMNRRGERARSSGWGWLIGDEGSAGWIALRALNAASRAYDGRGPWTSLINRLASYFGVSNLLNILDKVYSEPPEIDKIAELARLVSEEAERGDEVSVSILREAGRELALDAVSVAERLGMVSDSIVVGGVGSVFNSRIVWETFKEAVESRLTKATVRGPLTGQYSILGPLVMGLMKMGIRLTQREAGELLARLGA